MTKFSALFLSFFLLTIALPAWAASAIQTTAKQAIVIDYETGTILMSKNAEAQMPTSSMSKVMSMYMVFEAIEKGQLALDDTLVVSEKAWRKGGSKMFVEVDKRVKVEDLIRGVIIQSGNDATIVLAEGLAGTEEAFAEAITAKAHELGMKNSQFKNASGWPDPEHYSTAEDLAILAKSLIKNFPEHYKYYSEKEFTYNSIKQGNRNPLLYRNIGADGIKTGHTDAGGYGLIGSGTENGRRVILVINGLEDATARAEESAKLLEWGLKRFENKKLFAAGETVAQVDVVMGQSADVALVLKEDLLATLPKLAQNSVQVQVKYEGPLVAPIEVGQEIGTLEITIPGLEPLQRPLFAAEAVPSLGFFAKTLVKVQNMIARK